jgi:hypothetical protein
MLKTAFVLAAIVAITQLGTALMSGAEVVSAFDQATQKRVAMIEAATN